MPPDFLTVQEASDLLKTTPGTVCKWCRLGVLPALKLGKVWRISRVEFERRLAVDRQSQPLLAVPATGKSDGDGAGPMAG